MNTRQTTTVAFDEQIFLMQERGGISRYFLNLMKQLGTRVHVVFPCRYARSIALKVEHPSVRLLRGPALPTAGLGYLLNATGRRQILQAPIVHRTFYHPWYLKKSPDSLIVHTVHDMIPEKFPHLFPGRNPHLAKSEHLQQADLILCVSESTRQDLLSEMPQLTAPIAVTPLGVDMTRFTPEGSKPSGLDHYILYVGQRDHYKDFQTLGRAIARLNEPTLKLVAVGGGPFTQDEQAFLADLGLHRQVQQVDVTDAQLASLYRGAQAFVFPSIYEGFGLPTLEAMASGCPVILPTSGSHPEVGGNAARYFPAQDADALAQQIELLLASNDRRRDCISAGLQRAAAFTWQKTAQRTLQAYQSVALASK